MALVGASLLSLLSLGLVATLRSRALLVATIEAQLSDHQFAQVRAIRRALDGARDAVSLMARGQTVADVLVGLAEGDDGVDVDAVEDLRAALGLGDVLLVDGEARVVHATRDRDDLGTSLATGPFRVSGLADAVTDRLARTPVGETVVVDYEVYPPAGVEPVLHVVAAVSDGSAVVGALAVEIPISVLDAVASVEGAWEDTALGETGETYVVAADGRMRTSSRRWLDDPEGYLADLERSDAPPGVAEQVLAAGTTVLVQPVMTPAVEAALDGERFVGLSDDYLGRPSLTVAGPLGAEELDWVVVSEVDAAEARRLLVTFAWHLTLLAVAVVLLVLVLAWVVAARMTRPVAPVVAAATAIAGGDLDVEAPDTGRDELGDVGRRLNRLRDDLRTERAARQAREEEITELLASVLPPRLVAPLRRGDVAISELTDTATVVAVTVTGPLLGGSGLDPETAVELSARLSGDLEEAAVRHGLERIRSASDRHLFVAGLGHPDAGAAQAGAFTAEIAHVLERFEHDTGVTATHRAGLGLGRVASGLVGRDHLTYGVFGEPLRRAMVLDTVAVAGEILLDPAVVTDLGPAWPVEEVRGRVDMQGRPIEAWRLVGRPAA